jgi:uncharacterized protein
MLKLMQVLEHRFLALFIFLVGTLGPLQVIGQNVSTNQPMRGAAFEKSSARDADLAKIPVLKSQVTDLTGTLTASQINALEQKLTAFEARKGSQIAILLVSSTQPEAIEQYTLRVVEKWQLGRRKIDDGILLLVAKDDRRLRFEVGYGLEGAVNDLTAKRIITEVITPYFKQAQFYEGINAGIDRLMKVVDGEDLPPPVVKSQAADYSQEGGMEGVLLIAFMGSIFLGGILKSILGKTLGGITTAGLIGFLAFVLTGVIGIAIIAGLIGLVASMMGGLAGRGGPIIFPSGGGFGSRGGGFGSGGFGGGGGGFGGGGGGFGGGGASGGW